MTAHVALLRAVNVGGHGKVKMAELRALCAGAGLAEVQSMLHSGILVFLSDQPAGEIGRCWRARRPGGWP